MKYTTNLIAATICLAFSGQCFAQQTQAMDKVDVSSQKQHISDKKLQDGNWDNFNKEQLNKMIAEYGKSSPKYNPAKPPYAVFDWDNTSIFLDIQEALLIHQLESLSFGMTPDQLNYAIRMGLTNKDFSKNYNNAAGQPVNIDKIAPDIIESYSWLYNNYKGLKGSKALDEIKKDPHYANFITKMRYLYEAIGDTFDHAVSYPWVTYLLTGLNETQVRRLTSETIDWQLKQPIESVKWTSPEALSGRAGVVSISWKNGLRLMPEMQNLYQTLRKEGFDVWVCSASFIDVVKEFSSNPKYGYKNPVNHVMAMELERDAKGMIQTKFREGYDQTQGKGKTKTIERFLVSKYGYGPIFIAGDSEGDQNMMQDFADTKLVLIINRLKGSDIGALSKIATETYQQPNAKYLLQGRDDNKGIFVKSQMHYKLGATEGKLLK